MEALIIINTVLCVLLLSAVLFIIFRRGGSSGVDTEGVRRVVIQSMNDMSTSVTSSIKESNSALVASITAQIERLERIISKLNEDNSKNHIDVIKTLNDTFKQIIDTSTKNNENNVKYLNEGLNTFSKTLSDKLDLLTKNVDKNLEALRTQNNEKLESIKKTVDEQLDKTLSERLKASFDSVIKQIGDVNNAVGEIKGLAKDVNSLNRVLTNVKTKGIVGEFALANIIEEIFTSEQYETNVVTKLGAHDPVEFAIKMPGSSDDSFVYLPIDSKFPLEAYHRMKDASDEFDKASYESAKKELRSSLKQFAKKIHDKYIDPPNTTDFAVMFLPIEGLYVEALDMGLFEELQREYKINIAGPSTLTALLNALQVGFKSLVIQKRSSQVFDLLAAVKTEFMNFGKTLEKAQQKVNDANEEIEKLVGVRTRKINAKLKSITEIPEITATRIIDGDDEE